MNKIQISVPVNEKIIELTPEYSAQYEMLDEFAECCQMRNKMAVVSQQENDRKFIVSGSYCGFIKLIDGSVIDIIPKYDKEKKNAQKLLFMEFCNRCGFEFDDNFFNYEASFMENMISVFARESMKIIKSGVLSQYSAIEENLNTVQGKILFSENNRINLLHRERIYVRHDIFSPDRAENRLMKAAASKLIKITDDPHSSHLLRQVTAYLDDVRKPANIANEFSKCVNTRNTKKYSTVLSISRMLLDTHSDTYFSGKYVSCSMLFDSVSCKNNEKDIIS
ncbi:MAG: McrC family protein [Ruminococcus sp.]|nr:McrC family protein [Ruminococcus sp.]